MFTKESRTNVDCVEHDFAMFKHRVGEIQESLIESLVVRNVFAPKLLDRAATVNEMLNLYRMRPWGYSFSIDDRFTAFDLDRFDEASFQSFVAMAPTKETGALQPVDRGLVEMQLRLSILHAIFKLFGPRRGDHWLDIATNCGIIPLLLNQERQMKVTAVDLFDGNIQKASYLQQLTGKAGCDFQTADAFDYLKHCEDNAFDTLSALGLFYHLSDPIGMLDLMYRKTARMVVIDTVLHNFDFSGWIQTVSRHVKYSDLGHANDTRKIIELHPTFRGLVDALYQVGFERIIEVTASPELLVKYPAQIYKDRNRVFVVAFKNA